MSNTAVNRAQYSYVLMPTVLCCILKLSPLMVSQNSGLITNKLIYEQIKIDHINDTDKIINCSPPLDISEPPHDVQGEIKPIVVKLK